MKPLITWLAILLGSACSVTPSRVSTSPLPPPVPRNWSALGGPHRDPLLACPRDEHCSVVTRRSVASGGILSLALIQLGQSGALAIETPRGWFVEPLRPLASRWPRASHHEPRSMGYDLALTRIEAGDLAARHVDSQSVYYPGQGPVGTSFTTWSERRCRALAGAVHCSPLARIASQRCRTEVVPGRFDPGPGGFRGPRYRRTCTTDSPVPGRG